MLFSRSSLAVIIEEILILESDLVQKPGQHREDKTIRLPNSLNSIALRDVPREDKKLITVSLFSFLERIIYEMLTYL